MLPVHKGVALIAENFALNLWILLPLTNIDLFPLL